MNLGSEELSPKHTLLKDQIALSIELGKIFLGLKRMLVTSK